MTKSYPIARIAGIDISLHWTFLLFLAWIFVSGVLHGSGVAGAFVGLVFIVFTFVCVLLHELGHATAARWFGIPTHGITLLPIGGVAQLDRIPRNPWQELVIAIAGPAVNVLIAAVLVPAVMLSTTSPIQPLGILTGSLGMRLLYVNIGLVLFNLIPAFPMDGGRILRAFIALIADYETATRFAARCGQALALLLGLCVLLHYTGPLAHVRELSNPMLILVAGFVIVAAQMELNDVRYGRHFAEPVLAEVIDPRKLTPLVRELPAVPRPLDVEPARTALPPFPVIHVEILSSDSPSVFGR
jgi:Zn-dependent protease